MDGRNLLYIGLALIVLGLALLVLSMGTGDTQAGVFLIIPFFVTTSPLGALGGLLLIVGIFLSFIGWSVKDYELVAADEEDLEELPAFLRPRKSAPRSTRRNVKKDGAGDNCESKYVIRGLLGKVGLGWAQSPVLTSLSLAVLGMKHSLLVIKMKTGDE